MDSRVRALIDLFFGPLPYDGETVQAKRDAAAALEAELQRLTQEQGEQAALDTLTKSYGSLADLAVLAGKTPEDAARWRESAGALSLTDTKKVFSRLRWRVYLFSFLLLATITDLVNVFVYRTVPNVIALALMGWLTWLCLTKLRTAERAAFGIDRWNADAYEWLRVKSDQYAKRQLNSIALLCGAFALFVLSELSFYFFGNSKAAELYENVSANTIFLDVPLFLLIKNVMCTRLVHGMIGLPVMERFKKHVNGLTAFSVAYWLAVTAQTVAIRRRLIYPGNFFVMAGVAFTLLVLAYDLTLRRRVTFRNIVFNRRRVSFVLALLMLAGTYRALNRDTWYTQPIINETPVVAHRASAIDYDDETGVYTITCGGGDFKVLHLTDIHLGGSLYSYRKDAKALRACLAEIQYAQPDLVIVTGDLTFPLGVMSMSLNNWAPVSQFAAFMRNTGVPWAFTYGNHDTESLAAMSKGDLNSLYMSLSYKTSGNLLYPYVQPDVTGRNNQLIEVRNPDGSLMEALFLIDSNAYTGEGINVYDYIHDDQVDWYAREVERLNAEEGRTVSSMAFFHIPLQQYRTAYELYEQGSDEVTYFFGENGEKMIDKVCCSDYPSSLFDRMVELGSTKAVFCGHDHYNNMSLEYRGIRLTYGMSIDYLAMPGIEKDTAQRGAELITLHPDGSFDLRQIPLTGITD